MGKKNLPSIERQAVLSSGLQFYGTSALFTSLAHLGNTVASVLL